MSCSNETKYAGRPNVKAYINQTRTKYMILFCLFIIMVLISLVAIGAGAANVSPFEAFAALFGLESGIARLVVWNLRLPRVLAGIIAGAGLSIAGCVMQTCLRNPLASPSTLGISNAAAFGANIAIVFFGAGTMRSSATDAITIGNPYIVTIMAFIFSMGAMGMILLLAQFARFSPESVVLAGVAFGSLFSAGSALIQYFARDTQIVAMVFWTFGDLGRVTWQELGILTLLVSICIIYFMVKRWDYNSLDSGEDTALSLGVNVTRTRLLAMFAASLITSVAVAFMGIIGFIGLIGPHIMRMILGVDHRFLIPASVLAGAVLLIFSDTMARTMISPVVLPVGAITSFFGAPLFLFILMRRYTKR